MAERRRVDWAAVSATLTGEQRAALAQACALLGIPAEAWPQVPGLRHLTQAIAPLQLAKQLERALGLSWDGALTEACVRLGFNPDSYARMVRRVRRGARRTADADKVSASLPRLPRDPHRSAA